MAGEIDSYLSNLSLYGEGLGFGAGDLELMGGRFPWQRTISPHLYAELARDLAGMSEDKSAAIMRSTIEGSAAARRESDRAYFERAADMGMDPFSAQTARGEIGPRWEEQVGAIQGQVQASKLGEQQNILAGTTDAIARSIDYQKALNQMGYHQSRSRRAARKARKSAQTMQLASLAGGLALGGFGLAGMAGMGPLSGLATAGAGAQSMFPMLMGGLQGLGGGGGGGAPPGMPGAQQAGPPSPYTQSYMNFMGGGWGAPPWMLNYGGGGGGGYPPGYGF